MTNQVKALAIVCMLLFGDGSWAGPYVDPFTGRIWRQVIETAGLTYLDLTATPSTNGCSAVTGECNGSLTASPTYGPPTLVSLEGWQWATVEEVGQLFGDMGIPGFGFPYGPATSGPVTDSTWAPAVVDWDGAGTADTGYFYATANANAQCSLTDTACRVNGITRTLVPAHPGQVLIGLVHDAALGNDDLANTNTSVQTDSRTNRGVWLYQSIPEPGTYALTLVSLAALGMASRRRKVSRAGR
jgi:hypothetical protein